VVSLPTIAQLQLETRATSTVSVLVGTKRMFLDQVVSSEELKVSVETGRLAPLHVGASGRAMLAFAPPRVQVQVIEQELDRHTSNTITDPADLRSSLEQVRQDGFAVSRGEHTKVSGAVACPILAPNGFSIGAISACGPVETYTDKRVIELIPRVQHAAETVARLLAPRLHPGPRLR
jgi:DNA-binding IclR family transcriptional regulator